MSSSRGSWAALLVCTLLSIHLLAGAARSAETAPWFQSRALSAKDATRQLLARSSARMRVSGAKASQMEALRSHKAPDTLRMLVVGCDFADSLLWGRDRTQFAAWPTPAREGNFLYDDLGRAITDQQGNPIYEFAAHDSTYFDLQMRKTADYFSTVSRGKFTLQWQALSTLVNLPESMGYYGADREDNDRLVEMAKQVVEAIDPEVDFNDFDTLVLIHAGAGRETDINNDSPQQLFSNYLDRRDFEQAMADTVLTEPGISTQDGVLIRHVLILPETETQDAVASLGLNGFFGMRGVYCFEVGLRLGMLSLADFTPEGRPDSQGIGNYGLMGYGLFTGLGIVPAEPCAMNRMLMGWVDAVTIDSDTRVELPPIETGVGDTLLVKVPITDREYFLLEYRLQDPDGTFTFSFDDLNGNRVPDFYDADSSSGDGEPTSTFDPATDTWESTLGAEWDFFMSEFPVNDSDGSLRGPGRGNGLYVWHIDERVIQESLNAGSNTINADPKRKGVDLEEADGVQDLDTLKASRFLLGWDRDCFRGEGVLIGDQLFGTRFADDTLPSSLSYDGASIGFSISGIDSVQLGIEACNPGPDCPYANRFLYRDRLGFDLAFAPELQAAGVTLQAQRKLAADGPLDDVRLADLDGDGVPEILLAGDEGALLVLHGDLSPWSAGADPNNPAVLARATGADGPPNWLGAPVVGDLDGDGTPEIFLSAAEGVFAFDPQGNELRDGDGNPATFGLFLAAPQVDGAPTQLSHPCILAPHSGTLADAIPRSQADLVMIFRGLQEGDPVGASLVQWDGTAAPSVSISPDRCDGAARRGVLIDGGTGVLYLAVGGGIPENRAGRILLRGPAKLAKAALTPPVPLVLETPAELLSYRFRGDMWLGLALIDTMGVPRTPLTAHGRTLPTPWSALVGGPARENGDPVLAVAAGDELWLLDRNLAQLTGGPYQPGYSTAAIEGSVPAAPLLVDLDGDGRVEALWHDRVGRVHAVNLESESLPGWPIQGPGEPCGSPAVADLDGDGQLELVLASGFDALTGTDFEERLPLTHRVGEIRVYGLSIPSTRFAPWNQGGADAWGTGHQALDSSGSAIPGGGEAFADEDLVLYPNPADGPSVHVRIQLHRSAQVRSTVFDLQGQVVRQTGTVRGEGPGQLEFEIPLNGLVAGLYVAKVETEGSVAFKPFAIVR